MDYLHVVCAGCGAPFRLAYRRGDPSKFEGVSGVAVTCPGCSYGNTIAVPDHAHETFKVEVFAGCIRRLLEGTVGQPNLYQSREDARKAGISDEDIVEIWGEAKRP